MTTQTEDRDEPVLTVATPYAFNNMQRPPYVAPKRIPRDDEPEYSKRPAGFTIRTISGRE